MYLLTFQRVIFARGHSFVPLNPKISSLAWLIIKITYMMISQDVKVWFLFLILNGIFHPKPLFVNDTILKCRHLICFGRFSFFFSKYHHGLFVSHVFVVVTVLVFQCAAKFISVTEIHTYVINEKKNCSIFLLALKCTYSFLCFFVITSLKS